MSSGISNFAYTAPTTAPTPVTLPEIGVGPDGPDPIPAGGGGGGALPGDGSYGDPIAGFHQINAQFAESQRAFSESSAANSNAINAQFQAQNEARGAQFQAQSDANLARTNAQNTALFAGPPVTGPILPPNFAETAQPPVPAAGGVPAADPRAAALALSPPAPAEPDKSLLERGWDGVTGAAASAAQAVGAFDRDNGRILTRAAGVLQAVGGAGEALLGGGIAAGGAAASATGAGALAGVPAMAGGGALALNGLDNAQAGLRTAISGAFQHTLTAEAAGGLADAAGAEPGTAEAVRNGTDLASGLFGLGGSLVAGARLGGRTALREGIEEAAEEGTGQGIGQAPRAADDLAEAAAPPPTAAPPVRTASELDALAADPAHGGAISARSIQERTVGLDLERRGLVPSPITRDPSGAAEFVDAAGQRWDVKGFVSEIPARGGGTRNVFDLPNAVTNIERSLAANENVMLDLARLNPQDAQTLLAEVQRRGWSGRVIH